MYSYEDNDDCSLISVMNSELQNAQRELLNAHQATHQVRLRYSSDDLARFARREVLRKSAETASALNDFYSALEKKIPQSASAPKPQLSSAQMADAVRYVSNYLREQRDHYLPASQPLSEGMKARMWPYFSPALLEHVRFVELHGKRIAAPGFYDEARALGFDNLPPVTHMESLTFLDVVVFNQMQRERCLFHALVHAVQFQILGLERYSELFVQSFVKTQAHFNVPLEAHAFSLESKFMRPSIERFSVEEQVLRWVREGRYKASPSLR